MKTCSTLKRMRKDVLNLQQPGASTQVALIPGKACVSQAMPSTNWH